MPLEEEELTELEDLVGHLEKEKHSLERELELTKKQKQLDREIERLAEEILAVEYGLPDDLDENDEDEDEWDDEF